MERKEGFDSSKMNKIVESINAMNFRLEGDDEIVVDLVKSKTDNNSNNM